MVRRLKLPATLLVAGCSAPSAIDAGYDAGVDAGKPDAGSDAGCAAVLPCTLRVNACGMNCGCLNEFLPDGGFEMVPYCDPDVGNTCTLGCFNPRLADGGRQYVDEDAGTLRCLC